MIDPSGAPIIGAPTVPIRLPRPPRWARISAVVFGLTVAVLAGGWIALWLAAETGIRMAAR